LRNPSAMGRSHSNISMSVNSCVVDTAWRKRHAGVRSCRPCCRRSTWRCQRGQSRSARDTFRVRPIAVKAARSLMQRVDD
jgi:hypothetical protein